MHALIELKPNKLMGFKKINESKSAANTGFGTNASNYGGRLVNKDGTPNIRKDGVGFLERYSWFHSMLAISRTRFFITILVFYVVVNLLFTLIYYMIGVEHLSGLNVNNEWQKFTEAFFFSSQTFTTVGYGRISPTGVLTSSIAAFQALIGLLSFAVAAGLMYGRFSKPTAYLKFSDHALIAPFKGGRALMLRLAPYKNTTLTDAQATVTLQLTVTENDVPVNRFFILDLELSTINALTLSWTIVHPLTEESPLSDFTEEDFKNAKGEILVFIKAFDDMFSSTVIARTSYLMDEVIYGAKFIPMFNREGSTTILDLTKLNTYNEVAI